MVFLNIKGNNSEYTYLMYNFDDRVLQRVLINNPRQFILHTYPWGCGLGGGSQYIRVSKSSYVTK